MILSKGDLVKLKPLEKIERDIYPNFVPEMEIYAEKILTVSNYKKEDNLFRVEEDNLEFCYSTKWVDFVLNKKGE